MCLDTKFISNYEGKHHKIRLASNYHKGFKIGKEQNILFQINLHGNENQGFSKISKCQEIADRGGNKRVRQ